MRISIFAITVLSQLIAFKSFGQSTDVLTETNNQKILYENAQKSQQVKKNTPTLDMSSGKQNSKVLNLTDQEKQISEEFVHQGMGNRVIDENCNKDDEMRKICNGQSGKRKFLGLDSNMISMLSKAYALIGVSGDLGELSKNKTDGTGTEKASDYCKYIPTATETIAQFQQQSAQTLLDSIPANTGTAQKDALEKAAKSHDERAKQSQMQAVGWYGGAACYGVRMMTGGIVSDTSAIVKLGAATLLGTFYQSEVDAHKDYAAKVRSVANKLPGKGDCNPITNRLCYCSEPTTENDPTYCLAQMHKKSIAQNSVRTSCVNNEMKADPTCKCESTDTCFEKLLLTDNGIELGLGQGFGNTPFKGVRDLVRGELKGGTLSSDAYGSARNAARNALKSLTEKIPDNNPIPSGEKRKLYDDLIKQGLPSLVAKALINSPTPSNANSFASKFQGSGTLASIGNLPSASGDKKNNILSFEGGDGLGIKGKVAKEESNDFDLSKFANQKKNSNNSNAKVLGFFEKSASKASIAEKDKPIFDIISNRYQMTGRKRLEIEGN